MITSTTAPRGVALRNRPDGGKSISFKNVLTGKDGIEVSIPNIIVAIVVSIVVISSVVAGVVFIVPWAQNSSAQGDLQTVQSAQQIYYAQAAPPAYGSGTQLVATKALLATNKKIVVVASGGDFCAGTLSATGKNYWVTSATTVIVDKIPAKVGTVTCPSVATIAAATGLS